MFFYVFLYFYSLATLAPVADRGRAGQADGPPAPLRGLLRAGGGRRPGPPRRPLRVAGRVAGG